MKSFLLPGLLLSCLPLQAALIGSEDFTYADGPLAGSFGGTGWNYVAASESDGGTLSSWISLFGGAHVSGNFLVTEDSGIERNFNGNETEGAIQGTGAIFFRIEMTRGENTDWSGISFFDSSGRERIFFGTPYYAPSDGIREFGIVENNNGTPISTAYSGIDADSSTRSIIGVVDFDHDLLGLWVDADGSDFWDAGGGSAHALLSYTDNPWLSSIRIASGFDATRWDNLIVATDAASVGLIPEPSPGFLAGLAGAGLLLLMRRRI